MERPQRGSLVALLLLVLGPSCYVGGAHSVDPGGLDAAHGWLRAKDVAFVPQKAEDDCGAAALSMVLGALHVPRERDAIVRQIPPRKGGIRAKELRDYAREAGLRAFVVAGRREDLETQLSRGRPVLVGVAKPFSNGRAMLHYEVVAGLQPTTNAVLTLDPAVGWRASSWADFAREWGTTGAVTLLVFPPWDDG